MHTRLLTVLALSAMACGPAAVGEAQRSSNLAANNGFLYVADGDNAELLKVDVETAEVESLVVGADPKRVARIGDRFYITLGSERAVAVVLDGASGMTLEGVFEVGHEPFGIIASATGDALYVALAMEDAVVELDPGTLEEVRRFDVQGQPRWLAGHPNGRVIYAGSAYSGVFVVIHLDDGEVRKVKMPDVQREVFPQSEEDFAREEFQDGFEMVDLTPRITGDPALNAAGDTLVVPVLYVDHSTSVGGVDPSEDEFEEEFGEQGGGGYASGNLEGGLTRFNPAVVTFVVDRGGEPSDGIATLVAGRVSDDAMDDHFQEEFGFEEVVHEDFLFKGDLARGYITSLAFNDDGETVMATVEGSGMVVGLPAFPVVRGRPSRFEHFETERFGISGAPMALMGTGDGPNGIAYVGGSAWTFNTFSRSISALDVDRIEQRLDAQISGEAFNNATWFQGDVMSLKPSLLPPDVAEGRRMFFSASDSAMAVAGAGVSCATCHFDGRNDGLTWTFDHGGRQTPSLAGKVSLTAPVTWTNGVDTVADEARITSQGRMGGNGISHAQTAEIAAFIDYTADVDVLRKNDESVLRGRALFERADVGCATCHSGERYTNNQSYDMYGLENVNTPGLVGIAASAPYLHDGGAETLLELLTMADEIGMGSTKMLSGDELRDLEAYLRSL